MDVVSRFFPSGNFLIRHHFQTLMFKSPPYHLSGGPSVLALKSMAGYASTYPVTMRQKDGRWCSHKLLHFINRQHKPNI